MKTVMKQISLAMLLASGLQTAFAAINPNQFVEDIANKTLQAVIADNRVKVGDIKAINRIVDVEVLPYVDMDKTTRLATGLPWRQATPQQRSALIDAFKKTLVRTYSGAFKNATKETKITMLPFRGNSNADDVVVGSRILAGGQNIDVNYRLEKSGNSWKVYDFSVEGIWLIQNYRDQFSQEIQKGGIDGLIKALNSK